MPENPRRAALAAEIVESTGIDEAMIARLVHAFYARVREDALLGPVFAGRVADWPVHLERMCAFWSSVALLSGRYHGQPMQAHRGLPVDAAHFDRWLALFADTAREICPPTAADYLLARARRIAESLELDIAAAQGVLLARGQRFHRDAGTASAIPGRAGAGRDRP